MTADPSVTYESISKHIEKTLENMFVFSPSGEGMMLRDEFRDQFQRYKEILSGRQEFQDLFAALEEADRQNRVFRRLKDAFGKILGLHHAGSQLQGHLHQWVFPQFRALIELQNENDCRVFLREIRDAFVGPVLKQAKTEEDFEFIREYVSALVEGCPMMTAVIADELDERVLPRKQT